jgi:hypothetical protein
MSKLHQDIRDTPGEGMAALQFHSWYENAMFSLA